MKWGVRRYQNPDGTLTAAGQKRYGKMDAYRGKRVQKSVSEINRYTKGMAQAKSDMEDLRKNGVKSEAYKKEIERRQKERERDFEHEHSVVIDGERLLRMKYSDSLDKVLDDSYDRAHSAQTIDALIKNNQTAYNYAKDKLAGWTEARNGLMNMPISVFTNKRDIRAVENISKDIGSMKQYEKSGMKADTGRVIITKADVLASIEALEKTRSARYR